MTKENILKYLPIVGLLFITLSCNKTDDQAPTSVALPSISIEVEPNQTNTDYSSRDKAHYVVKDSQVPLDQLLLFLGGSFSTPKEYNRICDHAASLGLDVISLSYPNNIAAAPLGALPDRFIFDKYRAEICFGAPVSNAVEVNLLNSINIRTINLLQYLNLTYPDHNWGQYLTSSNTLRWDKTIVAGHSQGAGHACFLGNKNAVHKVVMFSGPNDYSTFFEEPANWLTESGATSLDQYFSLLHVRDEIVPFEHQVANLRGLGLLSSNEDPVLVDDLSPPYSNANSLSLNINVVSKHNAPIGRNDILPEIWTYMFTLD